MPSSSDSLSQALQRAFHAAMLLTGDVLLAEDAMVQTIERLEVHRDICTDLHAGTVDVLVRGAGYENQVTGALTNLPRELQRLRLLEPMSRDCFLLRALFNIPAARCAAILRLRIEDFEDSLCTALEQLPLLEQDDCLVESDIPISGGPNETRP